MEGNNKNKKSMLIGIAYKNTDDNDRYIRFSKVGDNIRIRSKYKLPFEITDQTIICKIKKALKEIPLIGTEHYCNDENVLICYKRNYYSIKDFMRILKKTKTLEYLCANIPLKNYRKNKNQRTNNEHLISIAMECKYNSRLRLILE